ncbi:MAG: hypothetical protein ACAF41_27085 [Leptolyngbya sp. BL-A-14]
MNPLLASTISIAKQGILYSLLWLISSSLLTASSAEVSPSFIKAFSKNELQCSREPESPKISPPPGSPSPIAASSSLKPHSPLSATPVSSQEMIEDVDQRCVKRPDLIKKMPLRYIPPLFRSCASYIYQNSKVPIVLPAIAHPKGWEKYYIEEFSPHVYYPYIDQITSFQYRLNWSGKPKNVSSGDPRKTSLYNEGFTSGEKIGFNSPSLASLHAEFRRNALRIFPIGVKRLPSGAPELGGSVALLKGIIGYYFPAMCGANCHNAFAQIVWDQGDYRYTVALIMSRREEIIEMANSAINNQRN